MATISISQVQGFAYDQLQNDLHIGFGFDIKTRIQNARWEDETRAKKVFPEKVDDKITPFLSAYAAEDEAYVIANKSEYTAKRNEKDAERDVLYRDIKKTIDTFATLTIFPAKQAAALKMKPVLEKYKINPDGGIEAQTVATDQWLQEQLRNYQLELAAKELGIFDTINSLKTVNDEVRRLTSLRNDERSQQTLAALKTARTATEQAYKALILILNAAMVMDDERGWKYEELIKGINETIKYYRQLAEQRKRRNAATREAQMAANEAKKAERESGTASTEDETASTAPSEPNAPLADESPDDIASDDNDD